MKYTIFVVYEDYSNTTGRYRNLLTGMDKKEFEKMLKDNFKWDNNSQSYVRKQKKNNQKIYIKGENKMKLQGNYEKMNLKSEVNKNGKK